MINKKERYKLNLEGILHDIIDTSSFMLHAVRDFCYFYTCVKFPHKKFNLYEINSGLYLNCFPNII